MYDAHIEYKQFIIQWNSTEKCSNPLPCWQICPAQFCVHWQTYEPGRFWQDPPFKHGDVKHSSTSKVKKKENYWGVIIIRDVSVFMDSACPRRSNSNENKLLRIFFSILEIMVPLNKNLFTVMIGPKFPTRKRDIFFWNFLKQLYLTNFTISALPFLWTNAHIWSITIVALCIVLTSAFCTFVFIYVSSAITVC